MGLQSFAKSRLDKTDPNQSPLTKHGIILPQSYSPCTIPKIQSEQMAEGYKELEWDCIAMQNHNAILNPHIIPMQSRNPTPIGEHTAGEYRTRVYVGRGVPGAVRSPIPPEF